MKRHTRRAAIVAVVLCMVVVLAVTFWRRQAVLPGVVSIAYTPGTLTAAPVVVFTFADDVSPKVNGRIAVLRQFAPSRFLSLPEKSALAMLTDGTNGSGPLPFVAEVGGRTVYTSAVPKEMPLLAWQIDGAGSLALERRA